MKETPILFSGPMVRALLAGQKTQTRRIIKPQPVPLRQCVDGWRWKGEHHDFMIEVCPFGKPGDRLWVKETFFAPPKHEPKFAAIVADFIYRADYEYREPDRSVIAPYRWRPSIFCTRKASRITLEITSVRVERLNDISEADARAEGAEIQKETPGGWIICGPRIGSYKEGYRWLWESINGAGSWDANPWVWVIEFRADKLREGK